MHRSVLDFFEKDAVFPLQTSQMAVREHMYFA